MPTILVIDDQPHMEELFSELLAQEGHTVLCAGDVTSAKNCLKDKDGIRVLLAMYYIAPVFSSAGTLSWRVFITSVDCR